MNKDTIQKELENIEKELRVLKSPQGAINNVESYTATISNPALKVRITYSDGKNDIITTIYVIGTHDAPRILTRIKNNQQYILTSHNAPSWIEGFRIVSTRPILSVENVS